jgi:Holliday junction resolvase RusA-like endonuclease
MIRLEFPGEPKAVQSFRFTRTGLRFQPKDVKSWKAFISVMAMEQLPEGFKPFQNACIIHKCQFVFALPKSAKKGLREMVAAGFHPVKFTRPDLHDNLFKGFCDALTGVVYADDSLICRIQDVSKVYGLVPHIELVIGEYQEKGELL